jgi:E3 ubiquitin-protein ligase BRE1
VKLYFTSCFYGRRLKPKRVEKERDALMDTNARLLRQSAEKDDMNAKSLSTILHLKNLTEQLTQGKISLEQQLKSANQLALAARLATNAKDRVAEEFVKEKEVRLVSF